MKQLTNDRLEVIMTLLRDQVKDALLSLENDEKSWSDFTVHEAAQAVHDVIEPKIADLQTQISNLQTAADPALAQKVTDLQTQLDATNAELAKHEADTTDADKIAALQTQADDTSGALSDFFAALKTANDPAAAIAALAAATGNAAPTDGSQTQSGDGTDGSTGSSDATS